MGAELKELGMQSCVVWNTGSEIQRTRFESSWCKRVPKPRWAETDAGFSALPLKQGTIQPAVHRCPAPLLHDAVPAASGAIWLIILAFTSVPVNIVWRQGVYSWCTVLQHLTALYCWVTQSPGPWPLESSHSPLRNFMSKSLTFWANYCS